MKKTHITVLFLFITQLLCMVAYGANGFRPLKGIVAFHKQRDAIEYTTIIRFEVSFGGEEAQSLLIFLPAGYPRASGEEPRIQNTCYVSNTNIKTRFSLSQNYSYPAPQRIIQRFL